MASLALPVPIWFSTLAFRIRYMASFLSAYPLRNLEIVLFAAVAATGDRTSVLGDLTSRAVARSLADEAVFALVLDGMDVGFTAAHGQYSLFGFWVRYLYNSIDCAEVKFIQV
jgi:hypothetical protein